MNKKKYLHCKLPANKSKDYWQSVKGEKNTNLFSDLPFHQSMRNGNKMHYRDINTRPLDNFLMSKINQQWDDIYSEILSKIKPKYRGLIERSLGWYVKRDFYYDEHFMPRFNRFYQTNKPLLHHIFIDMDGILRYCETEEELKKLAIKFERRAKMREIFE